MKYTTATFATALYNTLPAVTFILALIVRLEKVKLRSIRSASKVIGTMASVGGTMIMTLVKGPALDLFWTKGPSAQNTTGTDIHSSIKGAVLVTIGCFSYACFFILYVRLFIYMHNLENALVDRFWLWIKWFSGDHVEDLSDRALTHSMDMPNGDIRGSSCGISHGERKSRCMGHWLG